MSVRPISVRKPTRATHWHLSLKRSAFTLVELLVVIAIIGILVSETTYNYKDYKWSASLATPLGGTVRHGLARWVVGYPRVAMGTTRFPINDFSTTTLEGYSSQHIGGINALLMDGSVHVISDSVNPINFNAMSTRAGGEVNDSNVLQ